MAFVEVTPIGNAGKMLIQISYIMSIAPVEDRFNDKKHCKILVPGMMFEVEDSYETVSNWLCPSHTIPH